MMINKNIKKTIRLSQKEYDSITQKMKRAGADLSFSEFALGSMLNRRIQKPQPKKSRDNKALVAELARWGNNLNQVSRRLNRQQSGLDRVGLVMLAEIEKHISEIKKEVYRVS